MKSKRLKEHFKQNKDWHKYRDKEISDIHNAANKQRMKYCNFLGISILLSQDQLVSFLRN